MGDHFCLKWNNHQENLTGIMTKLLDEQKFVDVSLVCEMKTFKAHQTVLSACSPYFEQVLEENTHPHPIIILRDVKETEMAALLQYMYRGEVSVRDDELSSFLHTARALKVRGLSNGKKESLVPQIRNDLPQNSFATQSEFGSPPKRQKTGGKSSESDVTDKQNSDCTQSQTTTTSLYKSVSKPSGSSLSQMQLNYSENTSELHYSDVQVQQQTIKEEVDAISVTNEEQSAIQHHLESNTESRNDQYHKMEEWNYEYGSNSENRNYQSQKAEGDRTTDNRSAASSNAHFADPGGTDLCDGSKQWQIKYAFEKVEGSGFKCKICGQIKKHVRNHYLKHFPEHHECHLCRRTYTRKDNLNSHLKRDHFQRVKTPPDSYHRLRRLSKKLEEYPGLKCLTPDVFSQLKYASGVPGTILGSHGPCFRTEGSGGPAPMDLSVRPSSVPVPIQNQCAPIYDILPSFYNYFRN